MKYICSLCFLFPLIVFGAPRVAIDSAAVGFGDVAAKRPIDAFHYSYQYDSIGNRDSSAERGMNTIYAANQLNQYTQIAAESEDTFIPEFDDDGNQTLVKTATGIWRVTYNGYLQIANYHSPTFNSNYFIWDPTEPIATRPLACDDFRAADAQWPRLEDFSA